MEEAKKILIKIPNVQNSIELFGFIVNISEKYPRADISIITFRGKSWIFKFLPFPVETFELPKDNMNLFDVHQYCANNHHIFNIDLYFDLECTMNSAFMGFNFRAKKRVGKVNGLNKIFYTHKVDENSNDIVDLAYKELEQILNLEIEKRINLCHFLKPLEDDNSNVIPLFKTAEPKSFILIMLNSFDSVKIEIDFWKQFFDSFENQNFVIWSIEDEDIISDLFLSIDLGKNHLFMHKGKNKEELLYVCSIVKGVVVNNFESEALATYYGLDVISLYFPHNKIAPKKIDCFESTSYQVKINDNSITHENFDNEIRKFQNVNELVDQIFNYFKL